MNPELSSILINHLSGILDQAHLRQVVQRRNLEVQQHGHYYTDHNSVCILFNEK